LETDATVVIVARRTRRWGRLTTVSCRACCGSFIAMMSQPGLQIHGSASAFRGGCFGRSRDWPVTLAGSQYHRQPCRRRARPNCRRGEVGRTPSTLLAPTGQVIRPSKALTGCYPSRARSAPLEASTTADKGSMVCGGSRGGPMWLAGQLSFGPRSPAAKGSPEHSRRWARLPRPPSGTTMAALAALISF
jgi:hypothetical protein